MFFFVFLVSCRRPQIPWWWWWSSTYFKCLFCKKKLYSFLHYHFCTEKKFLDFYIHQMSGWMEQQIQKKQDKYNHISITSTGEREIHRISTREIFTIIIVIIWFIWFIFTKKNCPKIQINWSIDQSITEFCHLYDLKLSQEQLIIKKIN